MTDIELLSVFEAAEQSGDIYSSTERDIIFQARRLLDRGLLTQNVIFFRRRLGVEYVSYSPKEGPALTEAGEEKLSQTPIQKMAGSPLGKSFKIIWGTLFSLISLAGLILSIISLLRK